MRIFMELNYLLILSVAAINFILGAIWHSPQVFGKIWEEETGTAMMKEGEPPQLELMVPAFIASYFTALGTAYFIKLSGGTGVMNALIIGCVIAVFFYLTAHMETALFEKKLKLYWITAGYQALAVIIMSCLLGLWMK